MKNVPRWIYSIAPDLKRVWYLQAAPGSLLAELDALVDGPATDAARVRIVEIVRQLGGEFADLLERMNARGAGQLQQPNRFIQHMG